MFRWFWTIFSLGVPDCTTLFCVRFFNTFAHVFACPFVVFIMASPALLGSVGPSTETFTAYFKRLEQFFEANSINHYPADATAAVIQAGQQEKSL